MALSEKPPLDGRRMVIPERADRRLRELETQLTKALAWALVKRPRLTDREVVWVRLATVEKYLHRPRAFRNPGLSRGA
jgi:hypothetical protein